MTTAPPPPSSSAPLAPEIVAALVAARGVVRDAALALRIPERTLHRRLAGHADERAALATAHGWPSPTARASEARRVNCAARREPHRATPEADAERAASRERAARRRRASATVTP